MGACCTNRDERIQRTTSNYYAKTKAYLATTYKEQVSAYEKN